MKKEFLISRLGSVTAVAKLFDIEPQAVSQWSEDIPMLRVYQLKEIRPDLIKAYKKELKAA